MSLFGKGGLFSGIGRAISGAVGGLVKSAEQDVASIGRSIVTSAIAPIKGTLTAAAGAITAVEKMGAKTNLGPLPVPRALQPLIGPGRPVVPGGIAANLKPLPGAPRMSMGYLGGGSSSSGGGRIAPGDGGACPRGYHLNKHKLADGTPARSVCVRNRSMNPMNGRAVARAARRIHRGEKLLRRIFQVQGKTHGKIKPKGGRKR